MLVIKEKMKYLDKLLVELPQKVDPKDYRATPNVTITWLENCSGKTKIRDQELISDENDHSTGFGKGVSPAHTFLAGFGFSHFTQWGRAAGVLDLEIDSLEEQVRGWFDRRIVAEQCEFTDGRSAERVAAAIVRELTPGGTE